MRNLLQSCSGEVRGYRSYAQPFEKKLERIFWVFQIFGNRGFGDLPFGIIDRNLFLNGNNFQSYECPNRAIDMIFLTRRFSDFAFFNAT